MNHSTPGLPVLHQVYPNSCPLSQWCHPTISSSVVPFSSCLRSFPASGSFPMSQFFAAGSRGIGASASASVLPVNIQGWPPLGWPGWISLQSKGLSRVCQHHNHGADERVPSWAAFTLHARVLLEAHLGPHRSQAPARCGWPHSFVLLRCRLRSQAQESWRGPHRADARVRSSAHEWVTVLLAGGSILINPRYILIQGVFKQKLSLNKLMYWSGKKNLTKGSRDANPVFPQVHWFSIC